MSRFTPQFFDSVHRETPPWDIGAAQAALLALFDEWARFTAENGWRILTVGPAQFESRIAPVPAVAAWIERLAAGRGLNGTTGIARHRRV